MGSRTIDVAAVGPPAFVKKIDRVLSQLDSCRPAQGEGALLVVVHADPQRAEPAIAAVRKALHDGACAVVASAPGKARELHELLREAGASDVLPSSLSAADLTRRLQPGIRIAQLSRRVRQQGNELVLISSLARRLVRTSETDSLLEDVLTGLGQSIDIVSAEIRVLTSPWRVDTDAATTVRWTEARGVDRGHGAPLDPHDIEALRCRMPVGAEDRDDGTVVFPLIARGQALATLRVVPTRGRTLCEDERRTLYGVGSLLAGAMENAERLTTLLGRSRSLEAQVAERTREAEEQKQLFQAVVDALPVSLHAIDRAFRVVVWNRGREEGPYGRPRGEVLGHSLFSIVGEDSQLREEFEQVLESGEPRISEVEGGAKKPPRLFRIEKIPMRLGRGAEVTHVITVARDMTDQRALERSMAQTDKMAAVGRLAAGIAHEINNPLATIAGCAEAMGRMIVEPLDDESRDELRQDAEVIESEAYRCKEIVGNLLDFSRSTLQEKTLCRLDDVARRALKLLRHNPRMDGVRIELDIQAVPEETVANEDQLVQVLLALLLNAADAADKGGSVAVRLRPPVRDDEVIVSVEDDGPGVPLEMQERIFEPFFTTKPPGQGTGLGLSVAYGIVQAHAGRLELISHPGLGTRFDIVLPVRSEDSVSEDTPDENEGEGQTRLASETEEVHR